MTARYVFEWSNLLVPILTQCQWRDGRRGQDGWGRYTRRRKWYRDAELVEVTPSTEVTPIPTPRLEPIPDGAEPCSPTPLSKSGSNAETLTRQASTTSTVASTEQTLVSNSENTPSLLSDTDAASTKSKRGWFKKKRRSRSRGGSDTAATIATSTSSNFSRRSDEEDVHTPLGHTSREDEWRLSDDIRMQLDI